VVGCYLETTGLFPAGTEVLEQVQTFLAIPQLHDEYTRAGFILPNNLGAQIEQH
jgi:hypothetical protein